MSRHRKTSWSPPIRSSHPPRCLALIHSHFGASRRARRPLHCRRANPPRRRRHRLSPPGRLLRSRAVRRAAQTDRRELRHGPSRSPRQRPERAMRSFGRSNALIRGWQNGCAPFALGHRNGMSRSSSIPCWAGCARPLVTTLRRMPLRATACGAMVVIAIRWGRRSAVAPRAVFSEAKRRRRRRPFRRQADLSAVHRFQVLVRATRAFRNSSDRMRTLSAGPRISPAWSDRSPTIASPN